MGLAKAYYKLCKTRTGHALAHAYVRALRRIGLLREFKTPIDALDLPHDSTLELMDLWHRIHWSSGDGMMPPDQLLAIYRLAASWPVRGDVVELGSWVGLTTCYLATACRVHGSGQVHAVDTFEGTKEGGTTYPSLKQFGNTTLEAFHAQIERAGVDDLVDTRIGFTSDVAKTYDGQPIRMLLIDADHSYEGVRCDYRDWLPHVAPGGLIVFHDYSMADVARFVDTEVVSDARVVTEPGLVVPNVFAGTKVADRPISKPRAIVGLPEQSAALEVL